jgi:hypothetical protein
MDRLSNNASLAGDIGWRSNHHVEDMSLISRHVNVRSAADRTAHIRQSLSLELLAHISESRAAAYHSQHFLSAPLPAELRAEGCGLAD